MAEIKAKTWRAREDSNLRPLDPEYVGVPIYLADYAIITAIQNHSYATFVPPFCQPLVF